MNRTLIAASCCAILAACGSADAPTQTAAETSPKPVVDRSACPSAGDDGTIDIRPGLWARILKNGYGRAAAAGDYAGVHAVLWVYDDTQPGNKGTEIWSSGGADPFEFQIGQSGFIAGWSPGIECMLLGEKRELVIAPELAYGANGRPPVPPNATLLYELELVNLVTPGAAAN
jgi:FKBP-type peptidyl-prolyl cis-trans isomerase